MSINSDRIFQGKSTFPEHEEWYYRTREGVAGPYLRKEDAAFALRCFIKYCQRNGFTGGRDKRRAARGWTGLVKGLAQATPTALGALLGKLVG